MTALRGLARIRGLLPRRTVRLRLTLVYTSLFLVAGTGLLAITYGLVAYATSGPLTYREPGGTVGVAGPDGSSGQHGHGQTRLRGPHGVTTAQLKDLNGDLRSQALQQHAAEMHLLLRDSGVALAIMALLSVGLGWIMAGRVLRPLRTVTAAARSISATSLNERLALAGPDDEIKELGDTFDELLSRLEASFQSQRQFVANASHELRTPLARQRIVSQVALADPGATVESLRAAHERVLASGTQQERLIDALLVLAQGQAGAGRQSLFDLAATTSQVIDSRLAEAEDRGLDLDTALAPAPMTGDPRLVERVVSNLVDNALRYNKPGGRIEVVTGIKSGSAVLSVTNTGPVVPDTAVPRLFQPFQRLSPGRADRRDGFGLGLSIVAAVANAHHATLTASPGPDGGLHVQVTFPPPGMDTTKGTCARPDSQPAVTSAAAPSSRSQPRVPARQTWSSPAAPGPSR